MTLILDFDNGLYRAHTFYEKVSRHEWIFRFAAIKHLNVHIKVKYKKQNCILISEILPLLMENISYFMPTQYQVYNHLVLWLGDYKPDIALII